MRRPSSARTSSACSATAPRNISSTPISGETTCIRKTCRGVEAEQAEAVRKRPPRRRVPLPQAQTAPIFGGGEQYLLRGDDGEPVEIVGSWSNITSRKAAEQAENAARARFDLLLHGAPAVVYSFEAGGSYAPTFVSENIKRVLGYEPDQYLKNSDFWRSRVHPKDLSRSRGRAGQTVRRGPQRRRIPVPQGRWNLLLGQRRTAPGQGTRTANRWR